MADVGLCPTGQLAGLVHESRCGRGPGGGLRRAWFFFRALRLLRPPAGSPLASALVAVLTRVFGSPKMNVIVHKKI